MFPAFLFKPVLLPRFEYRLNHAARVSVCNAPFAGVFFVFHGLYGAFRPRLNL